jgi:hypothetical protein
MRTSTYIAHVSAGFRGVISIKRIQTSDVVKFVFTL